MKLEAFVALLYKPYMAGYLLSNPNLAHHSPTPIHDIVQQTPNIYTKYIPFKP